MILLYLIAMHGGLALLEILEEGGARAYLTDLSGRLVFITGNSAREAVSRALNAAGVNALGWSRDHIRDAFSRAQGVRFALVNQTLERTEDGALMMWPADVPTPAAVLGRPRIDMPHVPAAVPPPGGAPVARRTLEPPPGWPSYLAIPPEATELAAPEHIREMAVPPYIAQPPKEEQEYVERLRAESAGGAPSAPATSQGPVPEPLVIPGAISIENLPPDLRRAIEAQQEAGGQVVHEPKAG